MSDRPAILDHPDLVIVASYQEDGLWKGLWRGNEDVTAYVLALEAREQQLRGMREQLKACQEAYRMLLKQEDRLREHLRVVSDELYRMMGAYEGARVALASVGLSSPAEPDKRQG